MRQRDLVMVCVRTDFAETLHTDRVSLVGDHLIFEISEMVTILDFHASDRGHMAICI